MGKQQELCYSRLRGQAKAKGLLRRALTASRMPHAYLFRGPDGVGKRLFARGVAAAVNCRTVVSGGLPSVTACGHCVSCRKLLSGNHPDFMVVSPEKGLIKIDQVRAVSKELTYPPYESAVRVVVLEDVHTMRREAANSLLKTLEEPPGGNLLILTADVSREVLPTLISRCQVVPFVALDAEDCAALLQDCGVTPENSRLLARLGEGSPGRGLLIEKQGMVELWRELVTFLLDPAIVVDREIDLLFALAERLADLREDLPVFFGLLRIWLRDQLVVGFDAARGGNADDALDREAMRSQGEGGMEMAVDIQGRMPKCWSSGELFAKLQAIAEAERQLGRNCNRNLVCEVLLFTLQEMPRSARQVPSGR